jgi:hypothetical protein
LSAAVFSLHADRPPVVQQGRCGPRPLGVVSLAKVRQQRQQLAWDQAQRAKALAQREEKRRSVEFFVMKVAETSAGMLMTDRELAAEKRKSMAEFMAYMQAEADQARAELADIDRQLRGA